MLKSNIFGINHNSSLTQANNLSFIYRMASKGWQTLRTAKGAIVEMPPPSGGHEKVIAFLSRKLTVEFDRLNLPYGIPKTGYVKTPSAESAYLPDILLLNFDNLTEKRVESPLFLNKG